MIDTGAGGVANGAVMQMAMERWEVRVAGRLRKKLVLVDPTGGTIAGLELTGWPRETRSIAIDAPDGRRIEASVGHDTLQVNGQGVLLLEVRDGTLRTAGRVLRWAFETDGARRGTVVDAESEAVVVRARPGADETRLWAVIEVEAMVGDPLVVAIAAASALVRCGADAVEIDNNSSIGF